MKFNRIAIAAVMLIALSSLFSGCAGKGPSQSNNSAQQEQADTRAKQEQTIMDKFTLLMQKEDVTPAQVFGYMDANIAAVSKENAAVMIMGLEQVQKSSLPKLQDTFADDVALQKTLIKVYQSSNSEYINDIQDNAVKNVLLAAKSNGFKVETAEGMYYPVIDYSIYKRYRDTLAPELTAYIDIMAVESEKPPAKDAALRISWDEVVKRALAQERYIAEYSASPKVTDIKMLLKQYAMFALYGANNTPLFAYDTNQMVGEAQKTYLATAWDDKNGIFSKKMKEYLTVLNSNNYRVTEQVREYQDKTGKEINQAMNRYYVSGIDDAAQFESTFTKLQALVAAGNKEAVADYVLYPLNVYTKGVPTTFQTKEELINRYDSVFTAQVKDAFVRQKVNETFVNYKGVMVGQGEIWFTQSDELKYYYGIKAINN